MVYNNVVISGILGIIFMKKIIALLTALLIAPSAMAIIYSEDTSDPAFLQNKGYSQSLIRTIDMKKYHATGSENTYEKYYKEKSAFADKPETVKEHLASWYKKAKVYLDPIQDDDLLGNRETTFTNKPIQEIPARSEAPVKKQSTETIDENTIENL